VSVHYGNVAHSERSEATVEIRLDGIVRGWNNPEKTVGRDSPAVVMNLICGTYRV
jgi:hypothetical protein